MAVPANGLSLTQRRILTLLDTPARLGELPVGPSIDAERLHREAQRLAQAGLIASAAIVADPADAATAAARGHSGARRLLRPLPLLILTVVAVALVWAGWRLTTATSSPQARKPAREAAQVTLSSSTAPLPTPEPPVIATRVLRGDPSDRHRDAAKETPNATAVKSASTATPSVVAGAARVPSNARMPASALATAQPSPADYVRRDDPTTMPAARD